MPAIYDNKGTEIADIPLSEKQQTVLKASGEITVMYHVPQLLRGTLGEQSGTFVLRRSTVTPGIDLIVADNPDTLQKYVKLQRAIKAARES